MALAHFVVELKMHLKDPYWRWVLTAIRQDPLVWESLESGDLGKRAIETLSDRPENWSPAALSLLSLGYPNPVSNLCSLPLHPLTPPMGSMAARAYQNWQSRPPSSPTSLSQAALLALSLRERRRLKGSWAGLTDELGPRAPWLRSTLACLYGIVPDPIELVRTFLLPAGANYRPELAFHMLLSNPQPTEALEETIRSLLEKLPLPKRLRGLHVLSSQRPSLSTRLAAWFAEDPKSVNNRHSSAFMDQPEQIAYLLHTAEAYQYAAQPELAVPLLVESLSAARRLEAHLASQLAQATSVTGDPKTALDAWKQAAQLVPDSPYYTAKLALALLDTGRPNDAQAYLETKQAEDASLPHPVRLLAAAQLAARLGDTEHARLAARQALDLVESSQIDHPVQSNASSPEDQAGNFSPLPNDGTEGYTADPAWQSPFLIDHPDLDGFFSTLVQLLVDLDLPREAVRAVRLDHARRPNHPETLSLAAQALYNLGQASEALPAAVSALAFEPEHPALRRLVIQILEATGEWQAALSERTAYLEQLETPTPEDLHALANCALQAGKPEQAAAVCRQALHLDPDDGLTYVLLGQATLALGDQDSALEHFRKATQLSPHEAAPWLALAQTYRASGQNAKALEVLRFASQAAPNVAEIHLALGEACLTENAPTQALTSLRRASALAKGSVYQAKGALKTYPRKSTDPAIANRIALQLGQTLHRLGHLDEARQVLGQVYEAAGEKNMADPALAYAYAKVLLDSNELRSALSPLEVVTSTHPSDPEPYLNYARTIIELAGQPGIEAQQAIPQLQRVLQLIPNAPDGNLAPARAIERAEALALLAEALESGDDLPKSLDTYRQALDTPLAKQPSWRARLSLGLGRVALSLGQLETATAALQEAAQADPHNVNTFRSLSEAYLAVGLVDESFQAARTALQLNPSDLDTLVWFAEQGLLMAQQPHGVQLQTQIEAIHALTRATQIAPSRMDLLIRLGQMQLQNGDHPSALETFGKLVSVSASGGGSEQGTQIPVSDLDQAAQSLLQLGDAQHAIELLERAISLSQGEAETGSEEEHACREIALSGLLNHLAVAHLQAGSPLAALEALDRAITLVPGEASLFLEKADILLKMDRPQAALTCLENALNLSPEDAGLHSRVAQVLRANGELKAALDHAERSVLYEDNPGKGPNQAELKLSARYLASDLARSLLQPERAREILGERLHGPSISFRELYGYPMALEYFCLRAELALEAGEEPAAAEAVAHALEIDPDHPRALSAQARLSASRGDFPAAHKVFEEAFQTLNDMQKGAKSKLASPAQDESSSPQGEASTSQATVETVANWQAVGEAAVELGRWTEGLTLFDQAVEAAPRVPLAHLHLAAALVNRAETQRLYQAVDVITHAPGTQAVEEESFRAFESAIQGVQQALSSQLGGGKPTSPLANPAQASGTPPILTRWMARGQAVFNPSTQSAQALQAFLDTGSGRPEDVAELVAVIGSSGDVSGAARAAQTYPQHPLVLRQLALTLAESNPRQALGIARTALELASRKPSSFSREAPLLHTILARLAHCAGVRAGDPTTALHAIQAALTAWPDEPRWHTLAAEIYLSHSNPSEQPNLDAAISHLEQATRLEPKQAPHFLALGQVYLASDRKTEAVHVLEQASRIAPEQTEIWLALAQAQQRAGDLEAASLSAERAIERAQDPVVPLLLRGELSLLTNNPRGAQSRAQAVLRMQPEHPEALHLLARSLVGLNRPAEALASLEKAIPLANHPLPMLLERARLLRRTRGVGAALEAMQGLAEGYPEEPAVLALLAESLMESGQNEAAIQTARLALQADPDKLALQEQANLHFLIGRQLRRTGQLDQAVHHLSEANRQMPGMLEVYLELGRAHQDRRQHSQALAVYQQAIQVTPNDHRPYYQAGLVLKESKDYLGAETMLRHAAELAPNDVSIHRMLGAVVALNLVHNRRQAPVNL